MLKKKVVYIEVYPEPEVGITVSVRPLNHPSPWVDNGLWATTSIIVAVDGPVFETKNTFYVPLGWGDPAEEIETQEKLKCPVTN